MVDLSKNQAKTTMSKLNLDSRGILWFHFWRGV